MKKRKFYNAGDERDVENKCKEISNKRLEYLEDLRNIIALAAGKRFFKKFFDEIMVFGISFTGDSKTFFNEGKRSVGVRLLHDITEATPEFLTELLIRRNDDNGN